MATLIESLQPIAASPSQSEIPLAYTIRRIAPVLFAALGISLGSLTGVGIAVLTTANSSAGTTDNAASAVSSQSAIQPPAAVIAAPSQPALPVQASLSTLAHGAVIMAVQTTSRPALSRPASAPQAHLQYALVSRSLPNLTAHRRRATEMARARLVFFTHHYRRPVTERPVKPAHELTASAAKSLGAPGSAVEGQRTDTATVTIPTTLYVEGDLTVEDYNEKAGTIETSDGRSFLVGSTVASSDAVSWNDYRSNVHYRCSQTGSCTLSRAGAIALNARVI